MNTICIYLNSKLQEFKNRVNYRWLYSWTTSQRPDIRISRESTVNKWTVLDWWDCSRRREGGIHVGRWNHVTFLAKWACWSKRTLYTLSSSQRQRSWFFSWVFELRTPDVVRIVLFNILQVCSLLPVWKKLGWKTSQIVHPNIFRPQATSLHKVRDRHAKTASNLLVMLRYKKVNYYIK